VSKMIDMSAFVGTDFDCEFTEDIETGWYPSPLTRITCVTDGKKESDVRFHCCVDDAARYCRPRLNKPQVLDSWGWAADGLVWEVASYPRSMSPQHSTSNILCSVFLRHASNENIIIYAACIGVTEEYREAGEALGMPVVEVS